MKTEKSTYLTPDCVCTDFIPEGILCASPDKDDSTINDYDFVNGNWD